MANDDYERIILVKPEIFMYRLPPRTSNRAYRAADWKLDAPDWQGRLRIVSKGNNCTLKLEDKLTGELFAACPVDNYPGTSIESVSDSARYFVIRIKDEGGRAANIGIGFVDRSDSFDFNVALQDHFKYLKQSKEAENPVVDDGKKLDLSFKDGQTIKINIGKKTETSTTRQKPKGTANFASGIGLLPPPPSSRATPSNPVQLNSNQFMQQTASAPKPQQQQTTASNVDFLLDLVGDSSSFQSNTAVPPQQQQQASQSYSQNLLDF